MCFIPVLLPYDRQNGTHFSKSNGKDNKCVYHFIIICLMFEPFKKSEDNFIINKNIKILKRLWEKIILFSLNWPKGDCFAALKGNNSCKI